MGTGLGAVAEGGAIFAAIDIAARPGIQFHHGLGGKFNAGRGNSARSEKANSYPYADKWLMYDLSIRVPLVVYDPRPPAWRSEVFCDELWDHLEYVELFDLANDPDEKMNLAEDPGHARVLAKLRERRSRTIKELLDDQTRIKDPETRDSVPAKAA